MSFYTSLTGLNAATTQLSITSNNIANVGTTGFKRSRADFGDIFATSPLQKASSVIGQGVSLKAVTQEFSQGNIQFSANSLDIAITGDGFFPLKSADGLQDIYTRNGTFVLDDSYAVVNSAGQSLMGATVDSSGKADLNNLKKLIIPRSTTGDAAETSAIDLSLNLPADSPVIEDEFDPKDPSTYNLTTAVTVFDQGGNEYLATVYYVKTQRASPTDSTNKWQTHIYIGDTKLDEFLIQASASSGEALYVNKYGQTKSEGEIEPQLIARGVTKLYSLDSIKGKIPSVPAEYQGATILDQDVMNALKSGTLSMTDMDLNAASGMSVYLNIDNSPTPVKVDLSDLMGSTSEYSGIELARILETKINEAYGDLRNFDLSSISNSGALEFFTLKLNGEALPVEYTPASGADLTDVSRENLVDWINSGISAAIGAVTDTNSAWYGVSDVTASYSPSLQKFSFDFPDLGNRDFAIGATGTSRNSLFELDPDPTDLPIDPQSGTYAGRVIPNGDSIREYKSAYSQSDQRYGIKVRFDDTGSFSILSGTTGDASSVTVLGSVDADPDYGEANGELSNFQKIFNFASGEAAAETRAVRGVDSSPAVVLGGKIGVNLDNKFRLTSETNKITVTVDKVTGLVELPLDREYTKESFRVLLEQRINSLQDSQGRTVNGVKVEFITSTGSTNPTLRFTTGTQGDDSFLKISGPSFWGLDNLESARGTTERWLNPPQAEDKNGVALYVDREGNETTEAGDFSEEQTQDLWVPIYLDKGELTFDTGGNLLSPQDAIRFKATTIGETGATLQFSINYEGSTSYSSPFSVLAQNQNGKPEGDLIGLNIGDDGLVSANYSNGTQKNLAKIILANFTAPTGLRQLGDSSYLATSQSGAVTLGEAGTAGFGTIRAGARERANVDLTQELIELITAQRNFQANAKAIETNNSLTQTIIQMRS